jgi:HEAT repeat protein
MSRADDAVRERALRQHVAGARPEDTEWYLQIHRGGSDGKDEKEKEKEKEKRGKDEDEAALLYTEPLRELAFEGLASSRTSDELVAATQSRLVLVRRRALEELAARRDPRTEECAERMLDSSRERPDVRLLAARLLLDLRGAKFAERLYKNVRQYRDGAYSTTPLELLFGIADLLAELDDPKLRAEVLKELVKGQALEKRFHLRMALRIPDPKVDKALLQLSKDKHAAVVADALRAMGQRGNPTFVPRLEEVLEDGEDALTVGAALEALDRLRGSDPKWLAELAKLAAHPDELRRNGALEVLGRKKDPAHLPTFTTALAHPVWSTRLAAARGLEELRLPEGVGALCQRIALEDGRMAAELGDVLTRLTGKSFRSDVKQWERWWTSEGEGFRVPAPEEIEKLQRARDLKEEKQTSRSFRGVKVDSRFFGMRITSHHVAFVVDVSGSMDWRLGGQHATEGPRRMDVARKELIACLEALEAGTYFNILPFADNVSPWQEQAVECTEETFTEAKEFVEELGALGGTNVYAGVSQAFADPTVDTIFFLSDGEPSVGEHIDPSAIREAIKALNEDRGVVIHTISIGDRFPLLEWLATDSKGSYRTYP